MRTSDIFICELFILIPLFIGVFLGYWIGYNNGVIQEYNEMFDSCYRLAKLVLGQ